MELLVFNFCSLVDLQTSAPRPKEIAPPVWLPFEIRMDGVGSINPCAEAAKVVGAKGEIIVETARDVFEETTEFLLEILLSRFGDAGGEETGGEENVHATTEGDVEEFGDNAVKNVA